MVVGLYLLQSNASAAEAAGATHALLELLYLDDLGGEDALDDKLGDTVTLSDLEVGVGVVEEEDLDLAAVVRVDYAGTGVDEVLGGETGARGNAAVCCGGFLVSFLLPACLSFSKFSYVQVPAGTEMAMSVLTRALPRAGMVVGFAA